MGIRNDYKRKKVAESKLTSGYGDTAIYIYLAMVKYKHLGDDAAGSATAIGLDGSRGRGLNLWSVGGDGEEGSEEIH